MRQGPHALTTQAQQFGQLGRPVVELSLSSIQSALEIAQRLPLVWAERSDLRADELDRLQYPFVPLCHGPLLPALLRVSLQIGQDRLRHARQRHNLRRRAEDDSLPGHAEDNAARLVLGEGMRSEERRVGK